MNCPLCELTPLLDRRNAGDAALYECERCGRFVLTESAEEDLPATVQGRAMARPTLSHYVRRLQASEKNPKITSDWVHKVVQELNLPSPGERVDNLILALGNTGKDVGESVELHPDRYIAGVGASSIPSFKYLVEHLVNDGLAEGAWQDLTSAGVKYPKGMLVGRLTLKGWERYEELSRRGGVGTRAFIAMKFGEAELNQVLDKHLRPAVRRTGFEIVKLDDEPRAGLIDNRLRMEIKQARFLLADLTHANNGAYWEAGYAEGLGKPVIYLCKKAAFEDKNTRPHFDTNHHQTIIWDQATMPTDMDSLVATIRFSIPEARQSD